MPSSLRQEHLSRVLAGRDPGLHIVLDELCHPSNVSGILRTCDAFGVGVVHLIGETPTEGIVPGISKGAERWLELQRHENIGECLAGLTQQGFRLFCAAAGPAAVDLRALDLTGLIALVLGNESRGASRTARSMADAVIGIPMVGVGESLNVSVAAAVLLYEAFRQRQPVGDPPAGSAPGADDH